MKCLKLLPVILVLVMGACDKAEESGNPSPIDSVILISAEETSSGEIILDCRTVKEYHCSNFSILASKRIGTSSIEINFEAIEKKNLCATAFGPATTRINLGVLANGDYRLKLLTGDSQNSGHLKVTPNQLIFAFDRLDGIEIITPIVER